MEITSIVYLVFVGLSLLIYWMVPKGYQWIVLLIDSLIFYFLNAEAFTFLYLLISVVTVWLATNYFARSSNKDRKRLVLIGTIIVNIGILAVLKYTNFVIHTMNIFAEHTNGSYIPTVSWAAALGISFYTLQIVSYLLDSYWGVTETERNPVKLLLFTSYFPLMISGPINTHENLGFQLFDEHRFNYDTVTHGMKRIAWGLVKKLALSSRLSIMVDGLWNNISVYHGIWVWIAAIGYVFQLYTDFSGCMDIVIGVSECFGIRLAENFNAPLFSKTIQEFWQRWHITLGQWLRNYIMNPILKSDFMMNIGDGAKKRLGKKKGKKVPVYLSMLVLWFSMGIWHGNSWKYVIGEGLWFWAVIVVGQICAPLFESWKKFFNIRDGIIWKIWQIIRTNIIFMVGMLFFRADSFRDSLYRLKQSIGINMNLSIIKSVVNDVVAPVGKSGCLLFALSFIMLVVYDVLLYRGVDLIAEISKKNFVVRWLIYVIVVLIICVSYNLGGEEFEYAQF